MSAGVKVSCNSRSFFHSPSGRRLRPAEYGCALLRDLDTLDAVRHKRDIGEILDPAMFEAIRMKASDGVGRRLDAIQAFFELVAKGEADPAISEEVKELLTALLSADVLVRLVSNLGVLDFEVKKAVTEAVSWCIQLQKPGGWPSHQVVEHITTDGQPRLLHVLVRGCLEPNDVLHFSMLLKAFIRHSSIVEVLLREGLLLQLMDGMESSSFEVASEVFAILGEILFDNREVSAPYVNEHFEEFFRRYNGMLRKNDYVTVRQSLKLLGDLLFEPEFQSVMIRFVSRVDFLQLQMTLLRDKSRSIQFEAFNIFKIFVANPRKTPKVHQILYQNRDKLLKLLQNLSWTTREEDEVFLKDRQTTIDKLKILDAPGV